MPIFVAKGLIYKAFKKMQKKIHLSDKKLLADYGP